MNLFKNYPSPHNVFILKMIFFYSEKSNSFQYVGELTINNNPAKTKKWILN